MTRLPAIFLILLWSFPPVWGADFIVLRVASHEIQAEVAATADERAQGLMGRPQLAANQGMLFVFPNVARHAMWMKNTPLPLSAAFIDAAGNIVDIAEMQPYTLTEHAPRKPVKYVLEMNHRWFSQRDIKAGKRIVGLPKTDNPR